MRMEGRQTDTHKSSARNKQNSRKTEDDLLPTAAFLWKRGSLILYLSLFL